ncbi:T9SS type B sorting domain-containing protein [Salibacter halophilus]|nr:gliding motility-associated C-terminal domain-containing protein [Salibacter halophilus]
MIVLTGIQPVLGQCNVQFDLGNDTVLDCGSSFTISAPVGLDSYTWNTNATTSSITVSNAGSYTCTASQQVSNQVVNGDFSAGNTGFNSDYIYGTGGPFGLLSNEGEYAITQNSNLVHNNFPSCYDHTSGNASGSMMVVNGSDTAGQKIWEQTITVQPNTTYDFSTWAMSVTASNPAILSFSINGTQIGTNFSLSTTTCNWQQFSTQWTSGASTTATIAIVNQNTNPSGNDFAIDDISFSNYCLYSDTINVSIAPTPTLNIFGPDTVCEGDSVLITATSSVPGSTINWQTGNLTGDTLILYPTGDTTLSATATSPANCTSQLQQHQIEFISNLSVGITTSADTICLSNSVQLSAQATGGDGNYNYQWNPGGAGPVITQNPNTSQEYEVIVTDGSGCSVTSDTVNIIVRDPIDLNIHYGDTICPGDTARFKAYASGGDGQYQYNWENNWGNGSQGEAPLLASDYVQITVTDGCGTPSVTDSVFVQVGGYPQLQVEVSENDTVCSGESAVLSAQARGGDEKFSYRWDNNLGQGKVHAVAPLITTDYTVTVEDQCLTPSNTATITIMVENRRDFDLVVDKKRDCQPGIFDFSFDSIISNLNYAIDFGKGYKEFHEGSLSHSFDATGCHDIKAMVRTENGCVTTKRYPCMVEVLKKPLADFSFSPLTPTTLDKQISFINETSYGNQFKWYLDDTLYSEEYKFLRLFNDSGSFDIKLIAKTDEGCTDSISKEIFIKYKNTIWFPTAFTPNGDGLNDVFKPSGSIIDAKDYSLAIYNRWGNLMWETNNPQIGWNGIGPDGKPALNDSYVYDVAYRLKGEKVIHKRGKCVLVR